MRLGSLFDGSGTAPLAAKMCGIDPVWASEIEPYPIKVTKARFPAMKHLGSITIDRHAVAYPLDGIQYIVRRLTPLECCRLQGFPGWWEDGVEGSDSVRYKMWGNGMALPNMLHVMRGIAKQHEKELMR